MKIPTIFGLSLIFVILSVALMFYFYNQSKTKIIIQDLSPQNIRITNITPTSFTVNWFTTNSSIGNIAYGNSTNLGLSKQDDRDQTPRHTHFVTITNLNPQTTYFFRLRNDAIFYPQKPLSVTTAPEQAPTPNRPLSGTISTSSNTDPVDILVFFQTPNSSDLSTYVDKNLNYVLPLNLLLDRDLKSPITLNFTNPKTANLVVTDSTKNSFIHLSIPTLHPLPTLILGQNLELDNTTATSSSNLLPSN